MANVQHSSLPDAELHEPKGVAAASSGEVYVADGSASGAWTALVDMDLPKDVTGTDGYVKLPGGVIIQWGRFTSPSSGGISSVTFPTAFTTSCFFAYASRILPSDTGGADTDSVLRSSTTTSASFSTLNSALFQWFAIGY